jgi:hypothetical protein
MESYFIPSPELLALYDRDNDLRFYWQMPVNYSYVRSVNAIEWPGYYFFWRDRVPGGPTTAEMYLTKAECQARTGDFNGAMTTLNILRKARMKSETFENLTATSKDDAIKKILEERRREKPFTLRWYDIRRLNHNEDPNDDVGTITRTFYPVNATGIMGSLAPVTYKLEPNSRNYAAPIPMNDIISGQGELKQNTY